MSERRTGPERPRPDNAPDGLTRTEPADGAAEPDERAGDDDGVGFETTVASASDPPAPVPTTAPLPEHERAVAAPPRFRAVDVGARLGRYQLVAELGAGGMATVYRARDTKLRRDVALKVLFPHLAKRRELVARFQREARAAAALDTVNILRVHDVGGGDPGEPRGAPADPPYIVMELVEGESLREFIAGHDPPPAEVVACAGVVLCGALAAAHDAGIIHRDVKPANIMVAPGGRLALADFGVARVEDDDSSLVTKTGALVGTPAFMSPEQAVGNPSDERSDLYSLGATLYQLATGSMPFAGATAQVMTAIIEGDLVSPLRRNPAIGPDLSRAIERMMATDPAVRYANAREAADAFRAIARPAGGGDDPAGELRAYFADPAGYCEAALPAITRATLAQARQAAADGRIPRALALADRALALDPGSREALAVVESVGARRRARWLVVAVAVIAVVGAVALAASLALDRDAGGRIASGPDAAGDAGSADAAGVAPPGDAGVVVVVDAGVREPDVRSPDSRADAAARPRPRPRPRSPRNRPRDAGAAVVPVPVPVDARAAAPRPDPGPRDAPAGRPPAPAVVTFDLRPWCDLTIDGVSHGRASRNRPISLAPGRHQAVCRQGDTGREWREQLTLSPGERRKVTGSVLAPVVVRVDIAGGARVGRRKVAQGGTIELRPGRYSVTGLGGQGDLGWVSIPAVPACSLRHLPELGCFRSR